MKMIRHILRVLLGLILLPVIYILIALLLSWWTVNEDGLVSSSDHDLYLSSNGVHLSIILPAGQISPALRQGLRLHANDRYYAFGWGEKDFYLNTPEWSDLTLKTAIKALFQDSETLIHLTRYKRSRAHWVKIPVDSAQLQAIHRYILRSFDVTPDGKKQILPNMGYSHADDFYRAKGNYTLFYTCNTWVNRAFKTSGLPACAWTPFDFGLMNKYEKQIKKLRH